MDIIILILATWRISSLLVDELGPFEMFDRIRYRLGVRYNDKNIPYARNELAELFTCIWCMSVWIGLLIAILYVTIPHYTTVLLMPFALSAGAIIIKWLLSNR